MPQRGFSPHEPGCTVRIVGFGDVELLARLSTGDGGLLLAQQVQGNVSEHGEVLGRRVLTNAAIIFAESNIENPMNRVL